MLRRIEVIGDGVAACCCAHMLSGFECDVSATRANRGAATPTLLLNSATQRLLRDVFDTDERLFAGFHEIRGREVLWGTAQPVRLPHAGYVVAEKALLERLWGRAGIFSKLSSQGCDFTIHSAMGAAPGKQMHFGSRMAHAGTVEIRERAAESCWIEALEGGWLFLLPSGKTVGSLIAVGDTVGALLDASRLIGPQVISVLEEAAQFAAYPRILDPLCQGDWLACGNSAIGFDPLCGEGAGNAVREAILAGAVVRACLRGDDQDPVLSHYASRLQHGFLRHLETCRGFYASAFRTAWWMQELSELDRGIAWTRARLAESPPPRFRLQGFHLEPVC